MKVLLWGVCCITAVIASISFRLNKEVHYLRNQNIILQEKIEKAQENVVLLQRYSIAFDSLEKTHPKIAQQFDILINAVSPASYR